MMQVDTGATRGRGSTVTDATTGSRPARESHPEGDARRDPEAVPRTLRVDGHVARESATTTGPGRDRGTGTAGAADALGDTAGSRGKTGLGKRNRPRNRAGKARRKHPWQGFRRDGQRPDRPPGKRRRKRKTEAGPSTGTKEAREPAGNDRADTGSQRAKAGAIAGQSHEADRRCLRWIRTRWRHGGIRRAARKRTDKPSTSSQEGPHQPRTTGLSRETSNSALERHGQRLPGLHSALDPVQLTNSFHDRAGIRPRRHPPGQLPQALPRFDPDDGRLRRDRRLHRPGQSPQADHRGTGRRRHRQHPHSRQPRTTRRARRDHPRRTDPDHPATRRRPMRRRSANRPKRRRTFDSRRRDLRFDV
jgi:hypothetical protein